uniref:Uncharacterized protein n=1 Tax=Manihot esculenta TaxID=3983 RepID=A0A2C9WNH5_MANES
MEEKDDRYYDFMKVGTGEQETAEKGVPTISNNTPSYNFIQKQPSSQLQPSDAGRKQSKQGANFKRANIRNLLNNPRAKDFAKTVLREGQ